MGREKKSSLRSSRVVGVAAAEKVSSALLFVAHSEGDLSERALHMGIGLMLA